MTIPEFALATVIIVGFFAAFWPIVGQRLAAYRREREAEDYLRTTLRERLFGVKGGQPPLQGIRYDGSGLNFEDVCKRAGERRTPTITTGPLTPHDHAHRAETLLKRGE